MTDNKYLTIDQATGEWMDKPLPGYTPYVAPPSSLSGTIETPQSGQIIQVLLNSLIGFRVVSAVFSLDVGNCNVSITINENPTSLDNLSVFSPTPSVTQASQNNLVSIGDSLKVKIHTASSDAANLNFQINYQI